MTLPSGQGDTRPNLIFSLALLAVIAGLLATPLTLFITLLLHPTTPWWITWLLLTLAWFLLLLFGEWITRRPRKKG